MADASGMYDIGNARSIINNYLEANHPVTFYTKGLISSVSTLTKIDLAGLELRIWFDNGSYLDIAAPKIVDSSFTFEFVSGSATDADGNTIAVRAQDAEGVTYIFGAQYTGSFDAYDAFKSRMNINGYTFVVSSGASGGSCPGAFEYRTAVTCSTLGDGTKQCSESTVEVCQ